MTQLETFTKNFLNALYEGEFGVIFSRANTKIKRIQKIGGEEILIKYKDPRDEKQGIQILLDYNEQSYEIKYRGTDYKKLVKKIKKYFKKNNLKIGVIEKIK